MLTGMPRYELKDGSSNKFWDITLSGESFTTRWGRIGTDGQEKTWSFDDAATARKEYDKLVREKVKKGYQLVGEGEEGASASAPELEAAILQDPDSVEAYLVYGDWLQRQGDPRGRLIALQHAAMEARGEEAEQLQEEVSAFIEEHQDALLGSLVEAMDAAGLEDDLQVEWRLGFIRSARVGRKDSYSERDIAALVKELLAHPSARFIQELTIGMVSFDGINAYEGVLAGLTEVLTRLGGSKTLRRLFIGDFEYPGDKEISASHLADVSPLYTLLPNLRALRLRGACAELGDIDLPELREFTLETGGLPRAAVESITTAKWPKLERLEVWFGGDHPGQERRVEELQPILEGRGLPNLKALGLCNAEFTDALCRVLPGAKVLPRLERLDLSRGTLSDEGARLLAENAAAFAHLQHLDVTENALTEEGQRLVAALCPSVSAGNQRDFDGDRRYAAVGE